MSSLHRPETQPSTYWTRTKMPEASALQPLINMAFFLLAVNLAYLRFETFKHRERIKKHAVEKLGAVDAVPDDLKLSNYYKRLSYWAGISRDRKAVIEKLGWGWWYPVVFDPQRDRRASTIMIWIAWPVVLGGTIDASGLLQIPGQAEWMGWLLAALVLMTVVSVTLVLGGNHYISKACNLIDQDAEQWRIVMRDKTADARTRQTDRPASLPPIQSPFRPPRRTRRPTSPTSS